MVEKTIDVAKESTAQQIYDKVSNIDSKIQTVAEPLEMFNVSEYDVSSSSDYGIAPGETLLNLNGKVYCISTRTSKSFLYEMDDSMITSRVVSELPYPFDPVYSCALVYNNEIHILGGEAVKDSLGKDYINYDHFHYKWNGKKWEVTSELPYSCHKACAVVYHDEIHIFGGQFSDGVYTTNHYSWNGIKWTSCQNIPDIYDTKTQKIVFVYDDSIRVVGRSNTTGNTKILCSWDGNSWSQSVISSNMTIDDNTSCVRCTVDGKPYVFIFTSDGKMYRHGGTKWFSSEVNLSNNYVGSNLYTMSRYCATVSTNGLPLVSVANKSSINQNLSSFPQLFEFTSTEYYRIVGTLCGVGSQIPEYTNLTNYGRVVVHENELYLFSNYNNGTIFRFDELSGKWVKENITRNEIGATTFTFHGIVSMDDGIHLIGTVSENNVGCNHFVYRDGKIKLLSSPPFRFLNGSLVNHNGELHAIGGYGMKDSTYNHYRWNEEDDTWTAIGRTPYNVYGYISAASYRNCIFVIGYSENMVQEYIMAWANGRWIISFSKTNPNYTKTDYSSPVIQTEVNCVDCIFVHDNRLCLSNMDFNLDDTDEANISLLYNILLQNQDSATNMGSKLVTCSCYSDLKPETPRSSIRMLSYNDDVCVVDTFDGRIRLSDRVYEPIYNGTIKIFIPKGHKIHCSKSVYYPLTPSMKEIDEGFESIETTYHIFSRTGSGDELNYTIQ